MFIFASSFFFKDLKDIEDKSAEFIDSNTRRQDVDNTYMMYDVCRIFHPTPHIRFVFKCMLAGIENIVNSANG